MRYIRTDVLPVNELEPYPGNARVHDEAALAESARVNGQYRSIVARSLGFGYQILAGHGTVAAFASAGAQAVRVEIIEADDTEARRIVLADNATSRDATYDDRMLLDLLDAASIDGGLIGTAWDSEDYERLLTAATPGLGEPEADTATAPDEFTSYDDETIQTEHRCPKCGYEYSGGGG